MNSPWWQTAVIYQVYPRSFQDSNGDGVGDLHGIRRRIPYLADTLGIDAVWLSPFYPSPQKDFGYDVSDYTGVDPQYGTLDDFDLLLEDLHRAGLKLIVDWVPNHSSDQHDWFQESRSSPANPKRDWYVWKDAGPDSGPPNNWLSNFGGPAWEWEEATGQYYLHSFLKEQPDLNWRNQEVKAAMFDTLRFWLDRGVDGFRIDVAHNMMKDPQFRSNPVSTGQAFHKKMGEYDNFHHIYDKGHEDIHDLFREIRAVTDEYDGNRVTIGEIHEFDWVKWARYYEGGDQLSMPFNFALLRATDEAEGVRKVVQAVEAAVPEGGWPNYVWGNHDERRIASRFGDAGARRAAVLLLTLRGTPTLYYGDEIAMLEAEIAPNRQVDPWGLQVPGLTRDGCRTPMQWDGEHGFSDTADTWLPLGPDEARRNVASQIGDDASVLSLYRNLFAARRSSSALQRGAFLELDLGVDSVFAFQRTTESQTVTVVINYTDQECDVGRRGFGVALVSSAPERQPGDEVDTILAGEAVVLG